MTHRGSRRRLTVLAMSAAMLFLGLGTANAAGGWVRQTPVTYSEPDGSFAGVSCASPTSCVAVGSSVGPKGYLQTLAETSNGSSWSISSTVNPAFNTGATLAAVSCASTSECVAVGDFTNAEGVHKPVAETWNGSSWALSAARNPAGSTRAGLSAISCPTPTYCSAVGSFVETGGITKAFAETWNGSSWTV